MYDSDNTIAKPRPAVNQASLISVADIASLARHKPALLLVELALECVLHTYEPLLKLHMHPIEAREYMVGIGILMVRTLLANKLKCEITKDWPCALWPLVNSQRAN